jgi:glycosyltransferase involved in cell wall biosynthesis
VPALPNLYWLGLVEHATVPAYLARFDVALIPFVYDAVTRATSPVKLFEYLAAGCPVVATPLDEIASMRSPLLAADAAEFAGALDTARARREDPGWQAAVAADLAGHTWAARAGALCDALAARLRAERERPTLAILAGVPIDDSGGGQRPALLAMTLLARGWRVVYAHRFGRWEGHDLHLAMAHLWLTTCTVEAFGRDADAYLAGSEAPAVIVVECPHPDIVDVVAALKPEQARVVYDLIDDWDSALGPWYDRAADDRLIARADALVASSALLRDRLADRTGRPVVLIRNAVDATLFDPDRTWPRPAGLVRGRPTCLYFGSLWGDWFDWPLLEAVARAMPAAAFLLVGDYRAQRREPPPNLHFVGLRPRTELPAWLAHADVALVPFIPSSLTAAVSPLKVFEYVAMRVPVVSTAMPELAGVPGVTVAHDVPGWVLAIQRAVADPPDRAAMRRFALRNTWDERVEALLAVLDLSDRAPLAAADAVTARAGQ